MSIWVGLILIAVSIVLLCSNLSLRANLKLTKDLLELSRSANTQLTEKLQTANLQIEELKCDNTNADKKRAKIPTFLFADDPMDVALRDVGKLKK